MKIIRANLVDQLLHTDRFQQSKMLNTSDKLFEFVPRFKTKLGKLIEETKETVSNKINVISSQCDLDGDSYEKIENEYWQIKEKAADYMETIETEKEYKK